LQIRVRAHIIDGCGGHGQKSKKRRSANTFDLHNTAAGAGMVDLQPSGGLVA
jgi:hypothetical protein